MGRGAGGGGGLDEILIFPFFLNNEERNVLGMEETRFKTDDSQHGNDEKPTGRSRIYATKINFMCLHLPKKRRLVKVSYLFR